MPNFRLFSRIGDFFDEYGLIFSFIGWPLSGILCVLQLILSVESITLLIASMVIFGLTLVVFALLSISDNLPIIRIISLIVGVAALILAYYMIFEQDSTITLTIRSLAAPSSEVLDEDEFAIYVDIDPKKYHTNEPGRIQISLENLSDYTLVLNSVMFRYNNRFSNSFAIDYMSAEPPIDRIEKLANLTGLTFAEEEMIIPPGENYILEVAIVAKQPGDYSGKFFVLPAFNVIETEAIGVFPYEEKIDLVISSEE